MESVPLPASPTGSRTSLTWRTPWSLRLGVVIACAVYIGIVYFAYIFAVSPVWSYMGFEYNSPSRGDAVLFACLALLPSLWMPVRLLRPSQWIYLYLYIVAYVPGCIVPLLRSGSSSGTQSHLIPYVLCLCACMTALAVIRSEEHTSELQSQ